MFSQKYLSILYFNWIIYSCKCQYLEKFVAPILDNQNAPLVAIVDTRNISSHIVRSIEIPLREIINSTTQCKIKEELEKYAVSSQRNVNGQLETLQHKIDKHIEDLSNQFTVVNQDIVSLRKDTEDTISHEILEHKEDLTKLVNTLKSNLDKKMNNLSRNVVFVQSEVQKKIDKHIKDNRHQFTVLQQDVATLRREMEEKISHDILENITNFTKIVNTVNKNLVGKVKNLTNNVEIMQSELAEQLEQHSIRLGGHSSRLDDLNASLNAINSRAQQQQKSDLLETQLANAEEINNTQLQENVNLKILTELAQLHQKLANIEKRNEETEYRNNLKFSDLQNQIYDLPEQGFYEYAAIFTEPLSYSATTPVLYIHGHDDGNVTIKYNSFNSNMSITKGKNEMILKKGVFLRDGIENKGIHITSTVPITVYVFQTHKHSSDGYAAIPIKYMSTEYIVSSFTVWKHNERYYNSFFGIVSLSEYTNVKVKLKMKQGTVQFNGKEFGNGKIIEIRMSAFQTLQLSHNYDISGTAVSSSKPIGVVSGNICNLVDNHACNHATEMILPINQLDNEFIIPIIQTRPKSTVRLLSPGKGQIKVHHEDRHYETQLNEGEYHDLIHNDISVVQSIGNLLVTVFPHEAHGFDSYMMTVYGINQYKSDYSFIIPSNFSSFVSITFYGDDIRGFEIDGNGMKVHKKFQKIVHGKKYITFSYNITEGAHRINNYMGIRFGLWLYGNRFNDGYGYPAGIAFRRNEG
ncbi:uncharacterized protein LOC134727823 [Mytilus trossulus]|uniref:uncharacterized protein LOC134727823 n=1 Tax=Mytilus trossulus TaxID=6551 RepID=UPI0030053F01